MDGAATFTTCVEALHFMSTASSRYDLHEVLLILELAAIIDVINAVLMPLAEWHRLRRCSGRRLFSRAAIGSGWLSFVDALFYQHGGRHGISAICQRTRPHRSALTLALIIRRPINT